MERRPNGLLVGRMRIPLGVIGIIYESRPNVTADAAALCVKSGNAVVLRESHASTRDVAVRVRELLDEGRAFSVDAFGKTVLVLAGGPIPSGQGASSSTMTVTASPTARGSAAHATSSNANASSTHANPSVNPSANANAHANVRASRGAIERLFGHEGNGRRASFARSVSFAPGDLDAMTRALDQGHRVVAAPFMGRCGALVRGFEPLAILDVARGVGALTSSWVHNASPAGSAERSAGAHAARRETP